MTAKEMFEKLGYEYHYSTQGLAYDVLCKRVFDDYNWEQIIFHFKSYYTEKVVNGIRENHLIDIEEYQAINQQMKELGWIE